MKFKRTLEKLSSQGPFSMLSPKPVGVDAYGFFSDGRFPSIAILVIDSKSTYFQVMVLFCFPFFVLKFLFFSAYHFSTITGQEKESFIWPL